MWEAVDCLADLQVDKGVMYMLVEIVLVDCRLRECVEWYFHVLKAFHRGAEIEVFDVEAHVLGTWHADDAVPQEFGGGEIGSAGGEFARVIDEISSGC